MLTLPRELLQENACLGKHYYTSASETFTSKKPIHFFIEFVDFFWQFGFACVSKFSTTIPDRRRQPPFLLEQGETTGRCTIAD